MREVNMESLAISPPEESKQFLDGNLSYSTINWIIKTAINELTSFFSLFLFFFLLTMQLMSTVALVKKSLNIILEFPSSWRKRDFTIFCKIVRKNKNCTIFFFVIPIYSVFTEVLKTKKNRDFGTVQAQQKFAWFHVKNNHYPDGFIFVKSLYYLVNTSKL